MSCEQTVFDDIAPCVAGFLCHVDFLVRFVVLAVEFSVCHLDHSFGLFGNRLIVFDFY